VNVPPELIEYRKYIKKLYSKPKSDKYQRKKNPKNHTFAFLPSSALISHNDHLPEKHTQSQSQSSQLESNNSNSSIMNCHHHYTIKTPQKASSTTINRNEDETNHISDKESSGQQNFNTSPSTPHQNIHSTNNTNSLEPHNRRENQHQSKANGWISQNGYHKRRLSDFYHSSNAATKELNHTESNHIPNGHFQKNKANKYQYHYDRYRKKRWEQNSSDFDQNNNEESLKNTSVDSDLENDFPSLSLSSLRHTQSPKTVPTAHTREQTQKIMPSKKEDTNINKKTVANGVTVTTTNNNKHQNETNGSNNSSLLDTKSMETITNSHFNSIEILSNLLFFGIPFLYL
jgi:hypothetical protein